MDTTLKEQGDTCVMTLVGPCTEDASFEAELKQPPSKLAVNCRKVNRINSSGTRAWILFFNELRNNGTHLVFQECSPALMQQANCLNGFMRVDEIESICLPFTCVDCKKEIEAVVAVDEAKKPEFKLPQVNCPTCGKEALFDDELEDYLNFMWERR